MKKIKKDLFEDYFPKNHKKFLKTDKYYPYTSSLNRFPVEKEIWLDFPEPTEDGARHFKIIIPTESVLAFEWARRTISKELQIYCEKHKFADNSPERHRKLMELERAYYKPIREYYTDQLEGKK